MLRNFFNKIWQRWKRIAKTVAKVNSYIILTLFYFLIIGPVALIKKIINLFSKKVPEESYWVSKEPKQDKSDFENQF